MGNIYTEIEELVSRKLRGVEFDAENAWKNFENKHLKRKNNLRTAAYFISGIAAAVAVFVLSVIFLQRPVTEVGVYADAGKSTVSMPDGSKILLRGGSSLNYASNMSSRNRKAEFSGDGYFQIKKDPRNPFILNVGDIDIKVLGTTFNVAEDNEETAVSLIEGSVQLSSKNGERVTLSPGEKAVFSKKSGHISVFVADVEEDAVWTADRLSFHNTNIMEICRKLSVWYDRKVSVYGENLENYMFTFTVTDESLENIVDNMTRVHPELKNSIKILY